MTAALPRQRVSRSNSGWRRVAAQSLTEQYRQCVCSRQKLQSLAPAGKTLLRPGLTSPWIGPWQMAPIPASRRSNAAQPEPNAHKPDEVARPAVLNACIRAAPFMANMVALTGLLFKQARFSDARVFYTLASWRILPDWV